MKFNFLKKKNILFLGIFLILSISIVFVSSLSNSNRISLKEGKNIVIFNATNSFNVSILVKLNPQIEVVSYKEENVSFGYVNFLGGLGDNFEIMNGMSYEIYSSKNSTLILPE